MKNTNHLIKYVAIIIVLTNLYFINIGFSAEDPSKEIASYIANETGNKVTVYIAPNRKTKKGDIYIKVISSKLPSKDKTILSISNVIGKLTEESIAYKIYFDTIMIGIKDRLYAISTENCRKIFDAQSQEEQSKILQNNLKTLK